MRMRRLCRLCLFPALLMASGAPQTAGASKPETVASFYGPMPTGVSVSHDGRIFVNFPRWGDPVTFTVGELIGGRVVPYPSAAANHPDKAHPSRALVSVQSVVVDPKNRLWILDTGSIKMGPTQPGGPKLVGVDLRTNRIFKTILFPQTIALPSTYLNDIRFDLRRGKDGMAFITDSSDTGPNALIVVDLASGKSMRRLNNHPSTKAEPRFVPHVEGQPLMVRLPNKPPQFLKMGSDGIAISQDGKRLFYCPLASRRLYSVSIDALADPRKSDAQVGTTVRNEGIKSPSDGLESDAEGRVYVTDYEHHAILRRAPGGPFQTVVVDPRPIDWMDTMSLATDGYLYWTANQLQRQGRFHNGKDLRLKPYKLYRIRVDAHPVLLRP